VVFSFFPLLLKYYYDILHPMKNTKRAFCKRNQLILNIIKLKLMEANFSTSQKKYWNDLMTLLEAKFEIEKLLNSHHFS